MKALILSDIHSNIYALEAVCAQEKDCDVIYCTGDLVDYGPYPKEVLDWVRDHDVQCTQGNHDGWVALQYRQGNSLETVRPEEARWVHHNAGLLGESDIQYLEALPEALMLQLAGIQYGMTHLYRDYDEVPTLGAFEAFREESFWDHSNETYTRLILGHTHRQGVRYFSNALLWLNPGSVSYRRSDDPDQRAHYATITDGAIALKQLTYDMKPLQRYVAGVSLKESEMRAARRFFVKRP